MNRRDQPSTPFSCYRIDPSFLLCAPTSQTSSLEADYSHDFNRNRDLGDRFELLPNDHDEDSIFSESSGEKGSPDDVKEARDHTCNSLPADLFMPSLQSRQEYYDRRKMDESALAEEMSSPMKRRQSQSIVAAGHDSDPTFNPTILQPVSGSNAFQRSRSEAQILETFAGQPTMSYPNTGPSSHTRNQLSDLESMPSQESTSPPSLGSEEMHHATPTKSRSSCNSTANTAETSSEDLSSKNSSDSSEKSHDGGKDSDAHKFSTAAANESPTTAIYGLVDSSIKVGGGINGTINQESGARSTLLEQQGYRHRYARHRGSSGAVAEQRVPPNHLNSEIVINNRCVDLQGQLSKEEKRALLIELEELRQWKIAQKHEMEALKQEVTKKDESHRDQVSVLRSQLATVASNYAEQAKSHDARKGEIRELEQALERTKSALLAREMTLSTKNGEITAHMAELEKLKAELSSMIVAKDECRSSSVEPSSDGEKESELILELSEKNEQLGLLVTEMEVQLAQSNEKNDENCKEIGRLTAIIESATEDNSRLRQEVESSVRALSKSRDENSTVSVKCDRLAAEIEAANRTILESTDQITSLREELDGCATLASQLAECKECIKVLDKEKTSVWARLESKSTAYKELMARIVDQQDELKAAEFKLNESRDEASALRIQLEESQGSNKLLSLQLFNHQEKLKAVQDANAKLNSDKASLEESLQSRLAELQAIRNKLLERDRAYDAINNEEVSEFEQWKLVAQEAMEASRKEMEAISKRNEKLNEERSELIERLASKSTECDRLQLDNMKRAKEVDITKLTLQESVNKSSSLQIALASKSMNYDKLQRQHLAKSEDYETTLAQWKMDASAKEAAQSDKISKIEGELMTSTLAITELTNKVENQTNEITSLQTELHTVEKDLICAVSEVEELERQLSQSKEELSCRESELQRTNSECLRLASEIKTCQDRLDIADKDYVSLRVRFEYFEELSEELEQSKNECKILKARVSELEHQLSNEELAVINYEVLKLKKVNNMLSSKVKDLEYDVIDYQEMTEKKDKELADSKAYCEELELTIKSSTGEEPFSLQRIITSLRSEVKGLTNELEEVTKDLTGQNQCLEQDVASKTEEISRLIAEISSLKNKHDDLQAFIAAERGPRLDALRQLESDLREKEEQISQQLIESKNASNEMIQTEAKFVSLQLLNEAITTERDDLVCWKQHAEEKLQVLTTQVEDLTSRSTLLQSRCNSHESSIKEKEALIIDMERCMKSKTFAIARYEEQMIETSKEIASLRSKCQELEALTNNSAQNGRVSGPETNSENIEILVSEKADLESKVQLLVQQERSLSAQISTINEEKIALAKSSLDMAEAYEEKIKSLQVDVDRSNAAVSELEKQRCKYEEAQQAVKSLEKALLAVEKQRMKLQRHSP